VKQSRKYFLNAPSNEMVLIIQLSKVLFEKLKMNKSKNFFNMTYFGNLNIKKNRFKF
jgi:hypothetical protein